MKLKGMTFISFYTLFDDLLSDLCFNFLVSDAFVVLRGNQNGVYPDRSDFSIYALVLHGDLCLCVWLQPTDLLCVITLPEPLTEQIGVQVGQGNHFLAFGRGIPDHESLVARPHVLRDVRFLLQTLVDLGALLVNVHYHSAVSKLCFLTCSPFPSSRRRTPPLLSHAL